MNIIQVDSENNIIKQRVNLKEEFPRTSFPHPLTQSSLPEGYFIVEPPPEPPPSPLWYQKIVEVDPTYNSQNEKWYKTFEVQEYSQEEKDNIVLEKKNSLKNRVTEIRKYKENLGTTVAGVPVYTDHVGQSKLLGTFVIASQNPSMIVNWKGSDGNFYVIGATSIFQIATGVRLYVQQCFDEEKELLEELEQLETMEDLIQFESELNT